MKNGLRLASLLAALAIVAAACSGGGGTAGPGGQRARHQRGTRRAGSAAPAASAAALPEGDFALTLWTKEGEADGSFQYVKSLTDAYTAAHPNVTFEVVNKDVEALREDFQTSSLAGDPPDLLWTVSDHWGPFHAADLIQPVDSLIDPAEYVPNALSVLQLEDATWGVPISYGNQLMLYWNKELAGADAPADSDAWVAAAKPLTTGDQVGIAFNQTESFWLVPFLGGFGGSVFAEDGVTPTLDTDAMRSALEFLYDLKFTDKVTPERGRLQRRRRPVQGGQGRLHHQRRLDARRVRCGSGCRGSRAGRQPGRRPAAADDRRRGSQAVRRGHLLHGPEAARGRRAHDRGRLHEVRDERREPGRHGGDAQAAPRQRRGVRLGCRHQRPAPGCVR